MFRGLKMAYGFYGGIHPPALKDLTLNRPIKKAFIPKKVTIPLSQHAGAPAEPAVAIADSVKVGALIGRPNGFVSSAVHATISGKVTKIARAATPTIATTLSVTIESQDADQEFRAVKRDDVEGLSKEGLLDIIRDSGIVGLGGAAFPTHVKLSPRQEKVINSVILNGAECE